MTILTDRKKTVGVTMWEWKRNEQGHTGDWSNDFFEIGGLPRVYLEDLNVDAFEVDDVDYCVDQANDWMDYRGDFYDIDAKEYDDDHGIERVVSIRYWVVTN